MSGKAELYTTLRSTKTRFHTLTYIQVFSPFPTRGNFVCGFSFPLEECRWCLLEPPFEVKAKLLRRMQIDFSAFYETAKGCLLYTSPSPRDVHKSRMPSSA